MQAAAEDLLTLSPDGLQLTPGNTPTPSFESWLNQQQISYILHHGFAWQGLRQAVWNDDGTCRVRSHSVHPPQHKHPAAAHWLKQRLPAFMAFETMYPGYALGDGQSLNQAMDQHLPLAVDVSHLWIQLQQNLLDKNTLDRLKHYPLIRELHLSANAGRYDSHEPLENSSFGLDWLRSLGRRVPVVLECRMHRMSPAARSAQITLIRKHLS